MSEKTAREIFAKNLARYMQQKNIDQIELAEAIGVSQPTVSNWLKQTKYPRIKRLQELADYFGVKKSDLTEERKLNSNNQIDTIAAHIEDGLTEEQMKDVLQYIEFVKNKKF